MEDFNQQYQRSPPIRTGGEKVYVYLQCWASCLQNIRCTAVGGSFGFQGWLPPVTPSESHHKEVQPLTLACLPCHCIPFLSLSLFFFFFQFFWSWSPPLALWHVLPSVHADGAIQRSQKVCCPQIPLDSVGSLYHRAVGKTNEKLENTFQSTKQSRLI